MLKPDVRYYDFNHLTVLIVDDQSFVRAAVREVLKNYRCYDVRMAMDGRDAVNAIGEMEKLDLLLCDIEMKPMNGLQLVRAVRAGLTSAPYDLPIIMLTAHSHMRTVRAAIDLHANGFVVKPVRPLVLAEKIDWVMHNPMSIDPIVPERHEVDDFPLGQRKAPAAPSPPPKEEPRAEAPPPAREPAPGEAAIAKTREEFEALRREMVGRIGHFRVGELKAGSIVAQDVRTPAGAMLLKKGMTLTEEVIQIVRQHSGLGEILVLE